MGLNELRIPQVDTTQQTITISKISDFNLSQLGLFWKTVFLTFYSFFSTHMNDALGRLVHEESQVIILNFQAFSKWYFIRVIGLTKTQFKMFKILREALENRPWMYIYILICYIWKKLSLIKYKLKLLALR